MFNYVLDAHLKFKGPLTKRKVTRGIVLHHRAGWGDVESEHADSIARGWIGIGYNFYIRMDGSVWDGRGLEYVGAHAGRKVRIPLADWIKGATNNTETVGIGFEGYYHPGPKNADERMPQVQYDAGVRLIRDIIAAYPSISFIKGHKQMPAASTVCPGDYFPLEQMIEDGWRKDGSSGGGTTPKVTISRVLKLTNPNMRGEDVRQVQGLLREQGYSIQADGIYGPATRDAVIAFQKKKGLSPDGRVGKVTIETLGGAFTSATGVTLTRVLKLTSPNMRGEDVRQVQELLIQNGASLSADGIYGPNSRDAVIAFQKKKGLSPDGMVGKDTIRALGGNWA